MSLSSTLCSWIQTTSARVASRCGIIDPHPVTLAVSMTMASELAVRVSLELPSSLGHCPLALARLVAMGWGPLPPQGWWPPRVCEVAPVVPRQHHRMTHHSHSRPLPPGLCPVCFTRAVERLSALGFAKFRTDLLSAVGPNFGSLFDPGSLGFFLLDFSGISSFFAGFCRSL